MSDINEIEKTIQNMTEEGTENSQTQDYDSNEIQPETTNDVVVENPQEQDTESVVQEVEVLGKRYSNLKDLAKDYERLYQEFQERNTKKEEVNKNQSDEEYLKEAKRVLKERFGLLFSDDDTVKSLTEKVQEFEGFMNMVYEEMMRQRDEVVIDGLKKKYDGSHGEPKFDLEDIKKKVQENPNHVVWVRVGDEFYPDLEATYKKIYSHHWESKTPTRPSVVKTESGLSRKEIEATIPTEPKTYEEKVSQIEKFFKSHLGE